MSSVIRPRALPIRVAPKPGESLDSWLEALARRNRIPLASLLAVFGLRASRMHSGNTLLRLPAPALRRIENQMQLPATSLDALTASQFTILGTRLRPGSWFCPHCLDENNGRWPLRWRLPLVFACLHHAVLLRHACPGCGKLPRRRIGRRAMTPPACCPNRTGNEQTCRTSLRTLTAARLDNPAWAATQQWIDAQLTGVQTNAPAADHLTFFSDLNALVDWHLSRKSIRNAAQAHHDLASMDEASVAATLICSARKLVTATDPHIIAQGLRPLVKRYVDDNIQIRPPTGGRLTRWDKLSPGRQKTFLRALDPHFSSIDRIRCRSMTLMAGVPRDRVAATARLRRLPQMLWPEWTDLLLPEQHFDRIGFRAAVSAAILLPGHPSRRAMPILTALNPHRYRSIVHILRKLVRNGHDDVLAAICHLAIYLDQHGSPIDYQRRRQVISTDTITHDQWYEICYHARMHPGRPRRLRNAQTYLYQTLTGADLGNPTQPLRLHAAFDKSSYQEFVASMPPQIRQALHTHAAHLLDKAGIEEPVIFHPPPEQVWPQAASLRATQMDNEPQASSSSRRPKHFSPNNPAAAWRLRRLADQTLTPEFFQHEYVNSSKPLRQLETETGIHRKLLAERARQHGVPLHCGPRPVDIGEQWLRHRYLDKHQSTSQIAAEIGVGVSTIQRYLRLFGIAARPALVHSRTEVLQPADPSLPTDIHNAVQGRLGGWRRLLRFQQAMSCTSLAETAQRAGISTNALRDFLRQLEQHIGAKLFTRAGRHRLMQPTPHGRQLLHTLAQPEIQAQMHKWAGAANQLSRKGTTAARNSSRASR